MIIILDASAAAELVMKRTLAKPIEKALTAAEAVLAPELFVAEITNVFWKYHVLQSLDRSLCEMAIRIALQLPDEILPDREFAIQAFELGAQTKLSSYDMFYAALALKKGGKLLTLDKKLARGAKNLNISTFAF